MDKAGQGSWGTRRHAKRWLRPKATIGLASLVIGLGLALAPAAANQEARCELRGMGVPMPELSEDGAFEVLADARRRSCQGTLPSGVGRNDYVTDSVSLASPPAHGSVTVEGHNYVYRATSPSVNADRFILRICGHNRAQKGCANVTMNVIFR